MSNGRCRVVAGNEIFHMKTTQERALSLAANEFDFDKAVHAHLMTEFDLCDPHLRTGKSRAYIRFMEPRRAPPTDSGGGEKDAVSSRFSYSPVGEERWGL